MPHLPIPRSSIPQTIKLRLRPPSLEPEQKALTCSTSRLHPWLPPSSTSSSRYHGYSIPRASFNTPPTPNAILNQHPGTPAAYLYSPHRLPPTHIVTLPTFPTPTPHNASIPIYHSCTNVSHQILRIS